MKVLSIQDIAGFGRCSMTTAISVLSSEGHQCVPVPTAVYSTHTAIKGFVSKDLTEVLHGYINHYKEIEIDFSYIYSGFLNSKEQINNVIFAIDSFKKADVLVDPVMGDEGKIYKTYTPEMCEKMKELIKKASIITPNITEAKILLDIPLETVVDTKDKVVEIIEKLSKISDFNIIVTGIRLDETYITTAIFQDGKVRFYENEAIDQYFPGTGDLFASVLIGKLLNGNSLYDSTKKACNFVSKCISYTAKLNENNLFGVVYEPLLKELSE